MGGSYCTCYAILINYLIILSLTDTYNLDSKEWDVFILTGTLKLFFRELKEPLLTFELFDKLVLALSKCFCVIYIYLLHGTRRPESVY